MGSAGQRDTRKHPRQLRVVAAAGEDAVGRARFRQGRARRLPHREGLFPDVSRLLSGGQFVSAARQGRRAVPGDFEPARALGQRADGRHGRRKHRRAVHQFREAGNDRVFLRHGRLQRHGISRLAAGRGVLQTAPALRHERGEPALEHQPDGIAGLEQHPGAGFSGVAAGGGQVAAGLHGRIGRRHADVHPRRRGRPAGGAGADRDGVALNAGRLLVRECARIARRLFEHGNRRRARAAPADFRRRHG